MAIDTAEKRRSAFNVFGFRKLRAVTPNLSKDQEWRQEVFWSYSGILSDNTVIGLITPPLESYPRHPIADENSGNVATPWQLWFQKVRDSEYSIISSQAGVPGSIPTKAGLINIDTSAAKIYISTGTNSKTDWTLLN